MASPMSAPAQPRGLSSVPNDEGEASAPAHAADSASSAGRSSSNSSSSSISSSSSGASRDSRSVWDKASQREGRGRQAVTRDAKSKRRGKGDGAGSPRDMQRKSLGSGMVRALAEQLTARFAEEGSTLKAGVQHVLRVLRVGMGAEATASEDVLGGVLAEHGWGAVEPVWDAVEDLIATSGELVKAAGAANAPPKLSFEALATGVRASRRFAPSAGLPCSGAARPMPRRQAERRGHRTGVRSCAKATSAAS
jgi:hypothetical protein